MRTALTSPNFRAKLKVAKSVASLGGKSGKCTRDSRSRFVLESAATVHNVSHARPCLFLLNSVSRICSTVCVCVNIAALITVIRFSVNVPVLSVQRILILPRASRVDKLLQRMFVFFILLATTVNAIAIDTGKPKLSRAEMERNLLE